MPPTKPPVAKFLAFQTFFGLLGVVLYFLLRIHPGQIHWQFTWQDLGVTALAFIPLAAFGTVVKSDRALRIPAFKNIFDKLMTGPLGPFITEGPVYQLVLLALLAGVGEEWTFRGVLQTRLGLVAASVIFGLCHLVTPLFFFIAAAIGLYLGWIFNATGHNLFGPMTLHTFYDLLVLILLRLKFSKREGTGPGNQSGI